MSRPRSGDWTSFILDVALKPEDWVEGAKVSADSTKEKPMEQLRLWGSGLPAAALHRAEGYEADSPFCTEIWY